MATEALDSALDRIEEALLRLEGAAAAREAEAAHFAELKTRHRRLKESVTQELRQLDLLLANLPQ